jgi:hypothetical protein
MPEEVVPFGQAVGGRGARPDQPARCLAGGVGATPPAGPLFQPAGFEPRTGEPVDLLWRWYASESFCYAVGMQNRAGVGARPHNKFGPLTRAAPPRHAYPKAGLCNHAPFEDRHSVESCHRAQDRAVLCRGVPQSAAWCTRAEGPVRMGPHDGEQASTWQWVFTRPRLLRFARVARCPGQSV